MDEEFETVGQIFARLLPGVRAKMAEEKAGGAVETPPEGAARRGGRITARMGKEIHSGTPQKRSARNATMQTWGSMRR